MLSVRKFMAKFPDDESCRELLMRLRWKHGFICPKCGEDKHAVIRSRKLFECSACRTQTSVTAGTIMHRTKLPLRYWLLTIYWAASGERLSARRLSLQLKVNYRTALRMLHAIRQSMGRAAGNARFAFWMPARELFLQQVNSQMSEQADRFIRRFYGRIAPIHRTSYYQECRFRRTLGHHPGWALRQLLRFGAAANWP